MPVISSSSGRWLAGLLLACAGALPCLAASVTTPDAPLESWPLREPAKGFDDFADLAPLGARLQGVQVIALAEQTHGGHDEFLAKLRLLRYLHERQGFELLLLESGMYDVGRLVRQMEAGARLDDIAPGNVFYMYAKSAEGRELLRYIDDSRHTEHPLLLAGIDAQHTGQLSLDGMLPGLRQRLQRSGLDALIGPDWQDFARTGTALLDLGQPLAPEAQRAPFVDRLRRIEAALCGLQPEDSGEDSPAWWCRITRSLEAQARSRWSEGRDYQRDMAMGENAIWLQEHSFAGRKAVIWANTIHVARGLQRDAAHPQAGELMARHWGARYQVVQFSTGTGSYLDFVDLKPLRISAPPTNSLEAWIAAHYGPAPRLLRATAPVERPQFVLDYSSSDPFDPGHVSQLGRDWDWLVYLPRMTPVQMVR